MKKLIMVNKRDERRKWIYAGVLTCVLFGIVAALMFYLPKMVGLYLLLGDVIIGTGTVLMILMVFSISTVVIKAIIFGEEGE